MSKKTLLTLLVFTSYTLFSQVSIGCRPSLLPDFHAQLDVAATNKGVLIPRVVLLDYTKPDPFETTEKLIPESLLVYNLKGGSLGSGYYYWANDQWNKILTTADNILNRVDKIKPKKLEQGLITENSNQEFSSADKIESGRADQGLTIDNNNQEFSSADKIESEKANQDLITDEDSRLLWSDDILRFDKIEAGEPDQILITNENNQVVWSDNVGVNKIKAGLPDQILTTDKNNQVIWTDNVGVNKIKAGSPDQILTTNESNQVVWSDNVGVNKIKAGSPDQILTTNENNQVVWSDNVGVNKIKAGLPDQILITNENNQVVWSDNTVKGISSEIKKLTDRLDKLEKQNAVFRAGGGMVLWNKPANQIPPGWREVADWAGRMPMGAGSYLSPSSNWRPFYQLGSIGGDIAFKITIGELPPHSHSYQDSYMLESKAYNAISGVEVISPRDGTHSISGNKRYLHYRRGRTENTGSSSPMHIVSPYRVVLFIEYIAE